MNIAPRKIAEKNVHLFSDGFYNDLEPNNVCRLLDEKVVDFNYDEQTITIEFEVREWMVNPWRTLHGGMFAMCADMTTGALSRILCDTYAPTVSLTVNYLKAAVMPDTIVIKAYAVHLGRTNAHFRTEVRSKKTGDLLLTTNAIHFVAGEKQSQKGGAK